MRRSVLPLFLSFVTFAFATACSNGAGEGEPTGSICPTGSTLTYENFGQEFFESYCLGCHSITKTGDARLEAPDDTNYDTLAEIRATGAEEIDVRAAAGPNAVNMIMPPIGLGPIPSEDERIDLGEWLACGMP